MLATLYGCIKRRLTTKIANEVTTIKNGYNYLKGTEFLLKFDEKRQFLGLSCCDQTALQQEWKMGQKFQTAEGTPPDANTPIEAHTVFFREGKEARWTMRLEVNGLPYHVLKIHREQFEKERKHEASLLDFAIVPLRKRRANGKQGELTETEEKRERALTHSQIKAYPGKQGGNITIYRQGDETKEDYATWPLFIQRGDKAVNNEVRIQLDEGPASC